MNQSTSNRAALDTIQRNIWARINDEINLRGIKISAGDAYCLGSVIKEVLHPEVTALLRQAEREAIEQEWRWFKHLATYVTDPEDLSKIKEWIIAAEHIDYRLVALQVGQKQKGTG